MAKVFASETAKRAARTDARFVNAAMNVTLLGGIAADATEAGQEVSGVGGQFNFVEQAFALKGARAIITLPATRTSGGRVKSNILWDRVHETVPRPYRDVVITEYGIADLRAKTDEQTVRAMLRITDSRFQADLLEKAKSAGKIAGDFTLPEAWRGNTPERLAEWLTPFALPDSPFGTDFNATEQRLLPALDTLSQAQSDKVQLARLIWGGLMAGTRPDETEAMDRMALGAPSGVAERLEAAALRGALARTRG